MRLVFINRYRISTHIELRSTCHDCDVRNDLRYPLGLLLLWTLRVPGVPHCDLQDTLLISSQPEGNFGY